MFSKIKEALGRILESRLVVVIIVFCLLFLMLVNRVFYLQIVKGQEYLDNYKLQIEKKKYTEGTRGNIYDKNGNVLAYNKLAYSVTIEDNGSYISEKERNKTLNSTILKVIDIVESHNDSIVNDFGVVINANDEYEFAQEEGTGRQRFLADIYGYTTIDKLKENEKNASPDDVIKFLCEGNKDKGITGYGINQEDYDKSTVLKLVTIRYQISLNSYQKYIPTVIASGVSDETVAEVMENMDSLQGVDIAEDSVRCYNDSKYFASLIGYTGKISTEEYNELTADGKNKDKYSKTDTIGKAGLEQSLDEVLKGTKGEETVYVDNVGKVLETVKGTDAKAGNNLYLSIDKDMQIAAYNMIEEKLAGILLDRIRNVMNYEPDPEGNTKNIIIPISDVYYALLGNEVLDLEHLKSADAKQNEQAIYAKYSSRQKSAIDDIMAELGNPDASAYKDLGDEMQAYMSYVADTVLLTNTGVLNKDAIDTNDDTYNAWTKDESISLYTYLNYAISKNWIDTSKLQDYMPSQGKYSDASEIYEGILSLLKEYLPDNTGFQKLVYEYLVKNGSITGRQVCLALYEQGILSTEDEDYTKLSSGAISSYEFMRRKIEKLEITPGQLALEPCTGSMVVTDVNTGKVLVCVSYPGYDNNKLANSMDSSYYAKLNSDMSRPLYNSATQEKTAPGSTFKMISSVAGLTEDVISTGSYIGCSGQFDKISPAPKCWIYPSAHGSLNVVSALDKSCNDFFYEVGYRLGSGSGEYKSADGITNFQKYASMFGLSEKSGLEIPESAPQISDTDAVRTAIGQGTNNYTVSQLTRYVTTVANKGTLYDLSLLDHVEDKDKNVIQTYDPKEKSKLEEVSSTTWNAVHQGMTNMAAHSSTFSVLRREGFAMAGKTGTAEQSKLHADHALFVGFAPANKPEIAVGVRIANGYSSSYAAELGRDIVRYKYNLTDKKNLVTGSAANLGAQIAGD